MLKFAGVIPDLFDARRESIGWLLSQHDFRLRQVSAHPCERFDVYVWLRGGCCVSVAVGYDATTTEQGLEICVTGSSGEALHLPGIVELRQYLEGL